MIMSLKDVIKIHDNNMDDLLFWWITEEDIQLIAEEKLRRKLCTEELMQVSKGIDSGLGECWTDIVKAAIDSAIDEGVENWHKEKEQLNK